MSKTFKVLDKGYVTLQSYMGDDETIVKKARQSHDREHLSVKPEDLKLINYLMKNRHGTPFEMVVFTFNIKCPIFVMREWRTHRIGSFNEMSGRYVELSKQFYRPEPLDIRRQVDPSMKYKFEPVKPRVAYNTRRDINEAYKVAWTAYQKMLNNGIAKEVARIVLPVGIYTKFSWCVNLRSLFNFISLRSQPTAMLEIRRYSQAIELLIEPVVPVAFQAFIDNKKVAP